MLSHRRQWPLGGDEMRIGQVFQQQMPHAGIGRLDGLKAAGHQPVRQDWGNVPVERKLMAVRVRRTTSAVEMPHLENHRTRALCGRAVVIQAQPERVRTQFRKCTHHHDVANTSVVEHAGAMKCFRKMISTRG